MKPQLLLNLIVCFLFSCFFQFVNAQSSLFSPPLKVDTTLYGTQEANNYGDIVSSAGDINGDGYPDIVISSPEYTNAFSHAGRVELFFGTIHGINNSPAWSCEGAIANTNFGNSVSNAGDVNGDGYSDLIVGYELYSNGQSYEGAAYVFYGSAHGLTSTPNYIIESNQTSGHFAQCVSDAGDINNDGYGDVVIGSKDFYNGSNYGTVWVYYGSATGLNSINKTQVISTGSHYGTSVSGAGDVNGDNYDDIIVGQPDYNSGAYTQVGRVLVYYGSSIGINTTAAWTKSYNDPQKYSNLGESVSNAGDINGDGYGDIICSAAHYKNPAIYPGYLGRVYIFLGSATGLGNTANKIFTGSTSSYTGKSVSSAGDLNNDGYDEILFGASGYDQISSNNEGAFFIYKGSSSGVSSLLYSNIGFQSNSDLGECVSNAGDVNSDGFDDIICSAPSFDTELASIGCVVLTFGREGAFTSIPGDWHYEPNMTQMMLGNGISSGDVNGDSKTDVVSGALYSTDIFNEAGKFYVFHGTTTTLGSIPNFEKTGNNNDNLGVGVSIVGDLNGDGYDDLAAPANGFSGEGLSYCGKLIIYFGSASGFSDLNSWSYTGNTSMEFLGRPAKGAGDVNGDGFADLIFTASGFSSPETNEGAVFVFYGSAVGLASSPDLILQNNLSNSGFGNAISGIGDVNGDGYDDIAVSAPYLDDPLIDEGGIYIYLGNSTGLNPVPENLLELNLSYGEFGSYISSRGDINNDGYSDLLVGSFHSNDNHGRSDIYFGGEDGLSNLPDWTYNGAIFDGFFGTCSEIIGDVNNDSYDDIAISQSGNIFLFYGSSIGPLNTSNEYYPNPFIDNDFFGYYMSKGGDINNDAIDDLLISDFSYTNADTLEGAIFGYYGFTGGCEAPVSISVGDITAYEATLSWDAQPDVLIYIYRWKEQDSDLWNYGSTIGTSIYLNSLVLATDFDFELQHFCSTGVSSWTHIGFTTLNVFDCDDIEITGLTASTANGYDFVLAWNPIYLDINYLIRYKQTDLLTWNYLTTSNNTISLDFLDTCKIYNAEVAVLCTGDTSSFTSTGLLTVECPPCYYKPGSPNANLITSNSAKIIWTAVAGASSYRLQYRKAGVGSWKTKVTTATSLKLKSLQPSTTYEYKVQTVCGIYSSAYTTPLTFTTLPLRYMEGNELPIITFYPNPGDKIINIYISNMHLGDYKMLIYNMNGEEIVNREINVQSENLFQEQLDVSSFTSGIYLLSLIPENPVNGIPYFNKFEIIH